MNNGRPMNTKMIVMMSINLVNASPNPTPSIRIRPSRPRTEHSGRGSSRTTARCLSSTRGGSGLAIRRSAVDDMAPSFPIRAYVVDYSDEAAALLVTWPKGDSGHRFQAPRAEPVLFGDSTNGAAGMDLM